MQSHINRSVLLKSDLLNRHHAFNLLLIISTIFKYHNYAPKNDPSEWTQGVKTAHTVKEFKTLLKALLAGFLAFSINSWDTGYECNKCISLFL